MINPAGYGKALYELAKDEKLEGIIKDELFMIREAFLKNPEIILLLDCPGIEFELRKQVIGDCFSGAHEYTLNLIYILAQGYCVHLFLKCVEVYKNHYNKAHRIEHITAVTVIPLTDDEKEKLIHSLEKKRGTKIRLENIVDPSILGGIILKLPDSQIDASLRGRLERAKADLHKEKSYGY